MTTFDPLNKLEASLLSAKRKEMPIQTFSRELVGAELTLPSVSEVKEDGTGFEPILYVKHGTNMVAAFTDKTRIGELTGLARYYLTMQGVHVLRRIPPGYGLVIDPGLEFGLDLSPEGIVRILQDMG